MKKYFLFACVAAALVSCSSDEFLGENQGLTQGDNGAIVFTSGSQKAQRGTVYGSAAADLLGKRFIVEGTKGELPSATTTTNVVFDNYLVRFGENTAGTTESNTNNWEYVGIKEDEHHVTEEENLLTNINRTVDQQSIKYWDYSVPQYDFVAYSTGDAKMVSGTPAAGQVQVTKIDGNKSYSFTGLSAADLKKVYVTDVVTVEKDAYNKPVQLVFKNLTSKVRMALYETVPGYSVKDVEFFADDATATVAYTAATLPAGQTELDAANADPATALYTENAGVYTAYTTYDAGVSTVYTAKSTTSNVATLFNTASALPTSGTIEVTYPVVGATAKAASAPGYNKANVRVTAGSSTSNTQEFETLAANTLKAAEHKEPAGTVYLGRHSTEATFAGALADDYYQAVIPNPEGQSLTLRVNYTLVSTDGSNETIKVWGAKAIVPATYTKWQPNYAYTYLFKISDKSNGSTEGLGGKENLFPITFDAVVAEVTDATAEQTTITTVATPSITTYQKGHVYTDATTDGEYLASKGLIYVMVKDDSGHLAQDLDTKGQLYTVTGAAISEASVTDALLKQKSAATGVITGRNDIVLTEATSTVGNSYVNLEGKTVTLTETNCVASFTPAAGTYAYVYKVDDATAAGTYTAFQPKSYAVDADVADLKSITYATIAGTADLADNETADKDYLYFQVTKDGSGTVTNYSYITVVPGKTLVAAGEGVKKIAKSSLTTETAGAKAVANTFYFDVYEVNDAQYGVKVILVK